MLHHREETMVAAVKSHFSSVEAVALPVRESLTAKQIHFTELLSAIVDAS